MPDHTIYQAPRRPNRAGETVVTSTCGHNCGGRCVVNAHVVDGRIERISSDPAKWAPMRATLTNANRENLLLRILAASISEHRVRLKTRYGMPPIQEAVAAWWMAVTHARAH